MSLIGDTAAAASIPADSRSATAAAKNEDDLNKFLNLLVQTRNNDVLEETNEGQVLHIYRDLP